MSGDGSGELWCSYCIARHRMATARACCLFTAFRVRARRMPSISRSSLRPAVRPKIVKKKPNKLVRIEADMFKRMAVSFALS